VRKKEKNQAPANQVDRRLPRERSFCMITVRRAKCDVGILSTSDSVLVLDLAPRSAAYQTHRSPKHLRRAGKIKFDHLDKTNDLAADTKTGKSHS